MSHVFGPGAEVLWNKSKRKKRTGLTSVSNLPTEIAAQLGTAEMHYINGDTKQAIDLLSSISRQAPRLTAPYNILALIYEESGDYLRALQLYAFAATFTPKAAESWRKVARMANALGEHNQALAALNRCIKLERSPEFHSMKILLLIKMRLHKKAREALRSFLSKHPDQIGFLLEFGDAMERIGQHDTAVSAYLRFVFHWLGTTCIQNDLLLSLVSFKGDRKSLPELHHNLDKIFFAVRKVVDILLQKRDGLQPAVELITITGDCLNAVQAHLPLDSADMPQFPMDIALLLGICHLRLRTDQDVEAGLAILNPVLKVLESSDVLSSANALPGASSASSRKQRGRGSDSDSESSSDGEDEGIRFNANDTLDTAAATPMEVDDSGVAEAPRHTTTDLALFLLRQRIRISEELAGVGMKTRAEKLLCSSRAQLRTITAQTVLRSGDSEEDEEVELSAEGMAAVLANMWKSVGNVFCVLSREEDAYAAYGSAVGYQEHDVEALSKYAELTRLHFPQNAEEVAGMLSTHFLNAVLDFESARNALAEAAKAAENTQAVTESRPKRSKPVAVAEDHHSITLDYSAFSLEDEDVTSTLEQQQQSSSAAALPLLMDEVIAGTRRSDVDSHNPLNIATFEDDDEEEEVGVMELETTLTGDENQTLVQHGEDEELDGGVNFNVSALSRGSKVDKLMQQVISRNSLQHEVFALVEWISLFSEGKDRDMQSYCSVGLPLLEHWCFTASAAAGVFDNSVQKRRNKVKPLVSMQDLVSTDSCISYAPKHWLTDTHNICGRYVSAICDYVSVERLLGKSLLLQIATQTADFMNQLGAATSAAEGNDTEEMHMRGLSSELLHASTLMSLRRTSMAKRDRPGVAARVHDMDVGEAEEVGSSSESDSDSDYVDEEETGDAAAKRVSKSKFQQRMSTKKTRVMAPRRRKNGRIYHRGGVGGGLAFNDFRTASMLENSDPFIVAANNFSQTVKDVATRLFSDPADIALTNRLFRLVVSESSMFESTVASKFMENTLPVGRLYALKPDCVATSLLSGHEMALLRKNNEALDRYLDAFCYDPLQPLTLLCLGAYMVMLSNHSHIKHRHEVLAKGLMFLHRYMDVRQKQPLVPPPDTARNLSSTEAPEYLSELGVYQETLYNLGRAFHDVRLYHLAVDQYCRALAVADQNPEFAHCSLSVTAEAAHNLVLIYRHSGAQDLALEVMLKYLQLQ